MTMSRALLDFYLLRDLANTERFADTEDFADAEDFCDAEDLATEEAYTPIPK